MLTLTSLFALMMVPAILVLGLSLLVGFFENKTV